MIAKLVSMFTVLPILLFSVAALHASVADADPLVLVVEGYDDNDDVLMAAKVGSLVDRMKIKLDADKYELDLIPSFGPVITPDKLKSSKWLTFSVGRLKAGHYRVHLDGEKQATLKIFRSKAPTVDDFVYPNIEDFKLEAREDGNLEGGILSYSLHPSESLKDIRIIYQHNSVAVMPIAARFAPGVDTPVPPPPSISFNEKLLPAKPFLLLVRGRTRLNEARQPVSGDKLIVVE